MGPAVIITVGVLFLLQETRSGFSFGQTWPVILVVIGIISLASAMAPMDGHNSSAPAVSQVPTAGTPGPPANPAPENYPRQGQ
jgi:hypothetical protein